MKHYDSSLCSTAGTDHRPRDDIRGGEGVSGAVRGSAGLLLVTASLFYYCTQTENVKHWELRVVNECMMPMPSGWVVTIH